MEVEGGFGIGDGVPFFGSHREIKGQPREQENRGRARVWDGVKVDSNCGEVHVFSKPSNTRRQQSPRRHGKQSDFLRDCWGFLERVTIGLF